MMIGAAYAREIRISQLPSLRPLVGPNFQNSILASGYTTRVALVVSVLVICRANTLIQIIFNTCMMRNAIWYCMKHRVQLNIQSNVALNEDSYYY